MDSRLLCYVGQMKMMTLCFRIVAIFVCSYVPNSYAQYSQDPANIGSVLNPSNPFYIGKSGAPSGQTPVDKKDLISLDEIKAENVQLRVNRFLEFSAKATSLFFQNGKFRDVDATQQIDRKQVTETFCDLVLNSNSELDPKDASILRKVIPSSFVTEKDISIRSIENLTLEDETYVRINLDSPVFLKLECRGPKRPGRLWGYRAALTPVNLLQFKDTMGVYFGLVPNDGTKPTKEVMIIEP